MRLVAAILCWFVATVALAVAVPAWWAQRNLIDADGYAALAYSAAQDPMLQDAMAISLGGGASLLRCRWVWVSRRARTSATTT